MASFPADVLDRFDRTKVDVLQPDPFEWIARREPVGQLDGRLDLHTGIVSLGELRGVT